MQQVVDKLRHALGDVNDPPAFIETIPRRGYSFIGKVQYQAYMSQAEESADPVVNAVAVVAPKQPTVETESAPSMLRHARALFIAGLAAMFIAALLLGAAVTLYSYRRPMAARRRREALREYLPTTYPLPEIY